MAKADRTTEPAERIPDALLALLADKPFAEIGLAEIAARADVSLAELRGLFDGKIDILAAFIRRIDCVVLDAAEPPSAEDSGRDRLFDLIMTRLDAMAPYRDAVGHLASSARRDPGLVLCLNRLALDSARFMLAAAGISTGGLRGAARAQGFVVMMTRILPVWRDDRDPDLSRTMAAVDRALETAESWSRRGDRVIDGLCGIRRRFDNRRSSRNRHRAQPGTAPDEAAPTA